LEFVGVYALEDFPGHLPSQLIIDVNMAAGPVMIHWVCLKDFTSKPHFYYQLVSRARCKVSPLMDSNHYKEFITTSCHLDAYSIRLKNE
jgi:hypothetical protein